MIIGIILLSLLSVCMSFIITVMGPYEALDVLYKEGKKADIRELNEVSNSLGINNLFHKTWYIPIINIITAILANKKFKKEVLTNIHFVDISRKLDIFEKAAIEGNIDDIIYNMPKGLKKYSRYFFLSRIGEKDEKREEELKKDILKFSRNDVFAHRIANSYKLYDIENLATDLDAIVKIGYVDDERIAVITKRNDKSFNELFPDFIEIDSSLINNEKFLLFTTCDIKLSDYDFWKKNMSYKENSSNVIADCEFKEISSELVELKKVNK